MIDLGLAVCSGAVCQCSFGTAPCSLNVTSQTKFLMNNMPVATIMDNKPMNISGFGMCTSMANPAVASATAAALGVLTPQPCMPVIASPWVPGVPTCLLGGNPALNNSSKVMCNWGGIIQITNPSQQKIQV